EPWTQRDECRLVAPVEHLRVAHASPLETCEDRPELALVAVVDVDLPAVLHDTRHGERLAARTRAEIEHLTAWSRAREQSGDLAARVLHLEPALAVRRLGLDMRAARRPFGRRNAHTERREIRRTRAIPLERRHHLLARCLQRIRAQIDRCPLRHG